MDLDTLRTLPEKDQQIFLLGRIAAEATSMDAALRFVNSALRGHRDVEASLDAPDYFSANVEQCQKLINDHPELAEHTRAAVRAAVSAGSTSYKRRNRYIHDFLRHDLLGKSWELTRLSRKSDDSAEFETVSFDAMVDLVLEMVSATWRLRASALYVLQGRWEGMAFGAVEGQWDGSADYTR